MRHIPILMLCALMAATGARAVNYVADLKSKDDVRVIAAAQALNSLAMVEGLTDDEIEALASVAMNARAKPEVTAAAAAALAANRDVTLSAAYAEKYEKETKYFVAFLLWYSIYNTYAGLVEIEGGEIGSGMLAEMDGAAARAKAAYDSILDDNRRTIAQSYYVELGL